MLTRLFHGVLLAILAWFVVVRMDASEVVLGLALAAVFLFTGWRIYRLWQKYKHLLAELAATKELQLLDDPVEVARAERVLRSRRMIQAAEMSLMSGFVLGAAANPDQVMPGGDAAGGMDGMGGDGDGGGGVVGSDFGGGGFDGGM